MASAPVTARDYTAEQVDRGLLELALCAGNSAEASRRLKASGVTIPERTLRDWRTQRFPERYVEVANIHGRQVEEVIVQQCRENAVLTAELERKTAEHFAQELTNLKAGEAAGALRNLTTSKAINIDKVLALTGRPTEIREVRTADQIIRGLAARIPALRDAIDSTAEDIPDDEEAHTTMDGEVTP